MPDGSEREAFLTADYNAEMIEHIARFPRVRDPRDLVGDDGDVVPDAFGPDLPLIRDWTREHFSFAGYVTGFDPSDFRDRTALRNELGYRAGEQVCIVTVGGSGVGSHLLRRVLEAFPEVKRQVMASGSPSAPYTSSARPAHHFEQNFHVAHRLDRHGAGRGWTMPRRTPKPSLPRLPPISGARSTTGQSRTTAPPGPRALSKLV
jgi:hypothetical protein